MPSSTASSSCFSRRGFLGFAAGLPAVACVLQGDLKRSMEYVPEPLDDGWEISTPEEEGLDADAVHAAYERLFDQNEYLESRSLLIIANGKLVSEGYTRTLRDRQRLQHIKSCSKSFTSMLAGIALEQGALSGIDVRLGDILEEAAGSGGGKGDIRLEDLLLMASGLDWDNSVQTGDMMIEEPANTVRFILDRGLSHDPGTHGEYKDCDTHLIGAMVARATGRDLMDLAREHLFDPLGIANAKWEEGRDGLEYGAYGLWLRPRDMARVGVMVSRGGVWQDRQLVPADWLSESFLPRTELEDGPYGYQWWIMEKLNAVSADGHGGQYIYMPRDLDLVFVHTALPYTKAHADGVVIEELEELIGPILAAARA
jgi:CubicO group peptidase (beta-lactamase class C family)